MYVVLSDQTERIHFGVIKLHITTKKKKSCLLSKGVINVKWPLARYVPLNVIHMSGESKYISVVIYS